MRINNHVDLESMTLDVDITVSLLPRFLILRFARFHDKSLDNGIIVNINTRKKVW